MVTEHCSPLTKLVFGTMIQTFGPPEPTVASLCAPLVTQLTANQPGSTLTASVKVMVRFASRGAFVPVLRGSLLRTEGPISTMGAVRRGFGAPVRKSEPLTFVSVKPPFLRKSAVVLLGAGAFVAPSRQVAVVP